MKPQFILLILFIGLFAVSCKSKDTNESTNETTNESTSVSIEAPNGIAYKIDAPRSELKWTGFKPTGSHYGTVPVSGGSIYIDGDMISGGSVEIKMSELVVLDLKGKKKAKIEGFLKGTVSGKEDVFFNVQKYPTATFTILSTDKLENDPLGTHRINGTLTIKDITNPVSFKAVVDLSSGVALKVTAEPFVIDRSKWGIKYKSKSFYDDLKDDFINDQIRFELTIGAIKAQE